MEEITATLSNNAISENAVSSKYPSSSLYKPSIILSDQSKRRKQRLKEQKEKRYLIQDKLRAIDNNDETAAKVEEQIMEWTNEKKGYQSPLMLSEWLVEKPDDFYDKWMMVLCPEGNRTLVVASEMVTVAFSKRGKICRKFASALPGGNKSSRKKRTVLDCIWNDANQTYYVLDVLIWSGHSVMNCDTNFRFFWLKSKMNEMPELLSRNPKNKFVLKHLMYYDCNSEMLLSMFLSLDNVHRMLASNEENNENSIVPQLDGVLFYHKDSIYEAGITPLVGWLKPFMLGQVLNIPICAEIEAERPSNFTTVEQYVNESGKEVNYWWKRKFFK